MPRALRVLALALGALVLLVVLLVVAVLLLVDPNDYRDRIAAEVEARTGRPFAIEGELDLRVFPWLAVDVQQVSVGNPAGFEGRPPLLAAERLRVGVRLLPLLLRRELEVRRVAVEAPRIHLVTLADGRNNWEGLGGDDAAAPAQPGAAPGRARIAGLDLTRGELVLRDEADDSTTTVRELELRTGALGDDAPTALDLRGRVETGPDGVATRFALATTARVDATASRAEFTELRLEGERLPVDGAAGAPVPFQLRTQRLDYDWAQGRLAPTTVEARWGEIGAILELGASTLLGEARDVGGRLRVPEFAPRRVAGSLGVVLPNARDPAAFARFAATGAFRLQANALALEDLDLVLDDSRLRGRLAVADLEKRGLEFDLALDRLDVDRYRPPPPPEARTAAPAEPVELPRELIRELDARGTLRAGRLVFGGLEFRELRLPVEAQGGMLRLRPTAQLFGGALDAEAALDARRAPLALTLKAGARDVDVLAALRAYAGVDRLSGRASTTLAFAGRGDTDRALISSLDGRLDFKVANGALEGIDLWYEIRRAYALFRRGPQPAANVPPRTPFTAFAGSAALKQGVLASDDLRVEAQYVRARGAGTVRLEDLGVDWRLVAQLYEVPAQETEDLAGLRRLEIPLAITGTVTDYRVRPDLEALAKGTVGREVEERADEIKEKVRERVQDRLRGILGR